MLPEYLMGLGHIPLKAAGVHKVVGLKGKKL